MNHVELVTILVEIGLQMNIDANEASSDKAERHAEHYAHNRGIGFRHFLISLTINILGWYFYALIWDITLLRQE